MRDTSNLAFKEINESGKAYTQREQIYDFLARSGCHMTRQEISAAIKIPINAVCGRINELLKANRVEELERRDCNVTGNSAHPVGVGNGNQS